MAIRFVTVATSLASLVACGAGGVTIDAKSEVVEGAPIAVTWNGPPPGRDYIDIVPRGHTVIRGAVGYEYVRDSGGVVTVRAPTSAGDYDLRYVVDSETEHRVAAVRPVRVIPAKATLSFPAALTAGQALPVAWTGPDGPSDYIDIVPRGHRSTSGSLAYEYTKGGTPAALEAPAQAGDYEVRYVLEGSGGAKVLTTAPVAVGAANATVTAPTQVPPGQAFAVEWTGPASSADYVDLVPRGQTTTAGQLDYFYAKVGGPAELRAPAQSGDYEVRYVLEAPGGRAVLASQPVLVR